MAPYHRYESYVLLRLLSRPADREEARARALMYTRGTCSYSYTPSCKVVRSCDAALTLRTRREKPRVHAFKLPLYVFRFTIWTLSGVFLLNHHFVKARCCMSQ